MLSVKRTIVMSLVGIVTACGGGGGGESQPPVVAVPPAPDPTGLWVRSSGDGAGFASYASKLTQIVTSRSADAGVVLESAPAADGAAGAGFSGTYTLESAVDEYDIVKYNGVTLAIAPSRSGCCFTAEPLAIADALPPPNNESSVPQIALFQTSPESGTATPVATIELESDQQAEGMYLSDNRLQVLLSTAWWGTFGERFTSPSGWLGEQVSVLHFDITDPGNPVSMAVWPVRQPAMCPRTDTDPVLRAPVNQIMAAGRTGAGIV